MYEPDPIDLAFEDRIMDGYEPEVDDSSWYDPDFEEDFEDDWDE
jgi:hypothetical protein